jgi:hypothetical protein
MSAPSQTPTADVMCQHRIGAQHPSASHDELLARRHAQRAPRVSSLEAKIISSFFPAVDSAPNDASASGSSSGPTSAPPSASHEEFLARRHAQRAPRVSSLETKLTSSLDDCERVVHTDASSSDSSSGPTSAPARASHDEFLARRHAQRAPRVSSLVAKLTSSLDECVVHTPNDDTSSESSSAPTSAPPSASPTSSCAAFDPAWLVLKSHV